MTSSTLARFLVMIAAVPALAQQNPELVGPARHSREIIDISAGPDGKWFATASADNTVRIWSQPDALHLRTIRVPGIRALAAYPREPRVAAGDQAGKVRIFDPATGVERPGFDAGSAVTALAWAPDASVLVAASLAGTVVIDAPTMARLGAVPSPTLKNCGLPHMEVG